MVVNPLVIKNVPYEFWKDFPLIRLIANPPHRRAGERGRGHPGPPPRRDSSIRTMPRALPVWRSRRRTWRPNRQPLLLLVKYRS